MKQILLTILLILSLSIGAIGVFTACDSDDETTDEPTATATEATEGPTEAVEPTAPATEIEPTSTEPSEESGRLKVATTTSLDNTGLWETLEPIFEEENDVDLDIVAVGTGIALEYGMNGDVDVITVHSKAREEAYVADGYGVERVPFSYNYFLIIGPEDDPAGIKGMSPEDAFNVLFESEAGTFVSRGDDSGTHGKEKTIWTNAGYDYEEVRTAGGWYLEAGSGMGATLVMADEKQGYTLTDTGTYLAYKGDLDLVPIVDEGATLLNVYSVIVGTKTEMPQVSQSLVDFLTSDEVQQIMGEFGLAEYGMALFTPCAGPVPPCADEEIYEGGRLKVATTTSLDNTGLWETLEPMFEDENDVDLDIVAVGTGIALEYGMNGDVDVITVHSKAREEAYVADGYGLERVPFAYNYFLIVGPEDDPAGIQGMTPEEAFQTLFESESGTFDSRGDDSGTHGMEKSLWVNAGYEYEEVQNAGSWYIEAGSGMGATLVMADEKQGYTLTDTGTYLAYKGDLDLVPIVDEGDTLLNVYSVIVGTSTDMPNTSQALVEFLTSDDVQQIMGAFGVAEYGMPLFTPCAGPIAPCDN